MSTPPAGETGPSARRPLVIKLTCGDEAPERANQALTVAATAVAAGSPVSLWLAGEASWFVVPTHPVAGRLPGPEAPAPLPHAAPVADLVDAVLAGGQVTLCTQCALRRGLTTGDLLPGVRIAGAASFVEEVLHPAAQALVY